MSEPHAGIHQIGITFFSKKPIWGIRLFDGALTIEPEFQFAGTRQDAVSRAQDLLERYFPAEKAEPERLIVHRRGYRPTVGPKGGAGNSGASRR